MLQDAKTPAIIVYSKSGHSRLVAEHLANGLGITPFEVTTPKYTWPVLGWFAAGRDSFRAKSAPLDQTLDLPQGGLVVLVGPVWVGRPATPLNTVLAELKTGQQDVAVLLTCGDPKEDASPIDKVAERLGRPLKASMVLSNGAQSTPEGLARIDAFAAECLAEATAA